MYNVCYLFLLLTLALSSLSCCNGFSFDLSSSSTSTNTNTCTPCGILDANHPTVLDLTKTVRPKSRLKEQHLHLFKGDSVLDQVGRVICQAGVVSRKEFLESLAVATVLHNNAQGFPQRRRRMADLAAGHGLLAWCLLVLDELNSTKSQRPLTVLCVDRRKPQAASIIASAMLQQFPQFQGRFSYITADLHQLQPDPSCVMVSVHACGTLSDLIIAMSIDSKAPLAIVPCCHTLHPDIYQPHPLANRTIDDIQALVAAEKHVQHDKQILLATVLDRVRAQTLRNANYTVQEAFVSPQFTPRNRILMGIPPVVNNNNGHQVATSTIPSRSAIATGRMPPFQVLPIIPLEDTPESLAACQNLADHTMTTTNNAPISTNQQYLNQHLAIWLSTTTTPALHDLQQLTEECCQQHDIQCTVKTKGVPTTSTSSDNKHSSSQVYQFQYTTTDGRSIKKGRRTLVKGIHHTIEQEIQTRYPGVLRM